MSKTMQCIWMGVTFVFRGLPRFEDVKTSSVEGETMDSWCSCSLGGSIVSVTFETRKKIT